MDNLAHTLAGLALAEAGLKRKTALGTATLAVGANLPDVDVLVYFWGTGVDALAFRRGWTHGVLAMLVLPALLAALMLAWSRLARRGRVRADPPMHSGWLVALAAVGVWSHPLLDLFNIYGVRLLMPLSDRWFYGDTLFIIDPWFWLLLGAGVAGARWRARRAAQRSSGSAALDSIVRPARLALGACAVYVLAMAVSSQVGRAAVEHLAATGPARRTMVAPVALTPLRRTVVRDLGDEYEIGVLAWGASPRYAVRGVVPIARDSEGVAAASRTRAGAAFLSWSRFPRFTTERAGDSLRVRMSDVRYADARGSGWASTVVTVPAEAGRRPVGTAGARPAGGGPTPRVAWARYGAAPRTPHVRP